MYSLGLRTLKIPLRLYEENRFRLCEKLKNILGEKAVGAVVLLKGGDEVPIDATDITHVFRQESFFNWAFGVREPGFYGAIHLGSGKSTLFMPLLPEDYAVWMGHIETPEECRHKYQVNEVRYVKDIAEVLTQQKADLLLTLNGVNTDSNLSYKGAEFEGIENFNVDKDILFPEMSEWETKVVSTKGWNAIQIQGHRQCLHGRPLFSHPTRVQITSLRRLSSDQKFGKSTILAQEGTLIQELPLVFRKTNNILLLMENKGEACELPVVSQNKPTLSDDQLINEIRKCKSYSGVFKVLSLTEFDKVTGPVALQVLNAIAQLGIDFGYRNNKLNVQNTVSRVDSFIESAIFNQLFEIILASKDSDVLVGALKLVSRQSFPYDIGPYRLRLCGEVLLRVNECKFSINQIPEIVKYFADIASQGRLPDFESSPDMLWRCLSERRAEISTNNLSSLFNMLSHLRSSRKMVGYILECRAIELLGGFSVKQIVEILSIYSNLNLGSRKICTEFAGWLKLNIHSLNEEMMTQIYNYFTKLNFYGQDLESVLDKYLRKCPISDESFLIASLNWCRTQRVYNTVILEKSYEFFIKNQQRLSIRALETVVKSFGKLNYDPVDGKFWSVVEELLDKKFVQCPPDLMVDMLISCVYLGRYPLNFLPQVLSPFFLDRLQMVFGKRKTEAMSTLQLLDVALTIECPSYRGPKLPSTLSSDQKLDGRIVKMANLVKHDFNQVCHGALGISVMFTPANLPLFYSIDLLLHKLEVEPFSRFGYKKDNSEATAVLIHVPEHYNSKGELMGTQMMKVRQLELMGFQVISIPYEDLFRLKYKSVLMKRYLRSNLLFKSCIGRHIVKSSDDGAW
ncbi:uncharacterized protein LOC136041708 isoform X1 [Artemia franciscana]|uniref:uncharacterized protein LOC136041708 isoform X1 n=1 Tax=Artemia franciscana TaxID=6661 RepID=UPI0032DBC35C